MLTPGDIPANGTKVTLTLLDIFGKPYQQRGRIHGVRQHGYDLQSGGWGLQDLGDGTVSYVLGLIPYGKRKARAIRLCTIQALRTGWHTGSALPTA